MYRRHLGKMSNVVSVERIIAVSRLVPNGAWTTYAEVGEIVYGHRRGGQSVGNAMRAAGHADSEHRTLQTGGKVSPHWRGDGVAPRSAFAASATKVRGTSDVTALATSVSSTQTSCDGWGRDSYRAQSDSSRNAEGERPEGVSLLARSLTSLNTPDCEPAPVNAMR